MLLGGAVIALRGAPMMMRMAGAPRMAAVAQYTVMDYEQCILGAKSEDDVTACMKSFDDMANEESSVAEHYEQCILGAKSEDDVTACMKFFDEARYDGAGAADDGFNAVEECILQAKSEDDVAACMRMADGYNIDVSPAATTLSECLARADGTVDLCIAEVENQSDEHAYG